MKILILENDSSFSKILKIFLEQKNYTVVVTTSIKEAENITFNTQFNLYLFNINLPDGNALDFIETLRFAEDYTPTFFMTELEEMSLVKRAFDLDAFDYFRKPFNPIELAIRIEARFKQKNIIYKHIEFNPLSKMIKSNNKVIDMGVIPTNIFYKLIKDIGSIITKEELMESLDHPSANALRVTISKIKQRLNIEIKNIRTKGYLIEEG